MRELDGVLWVNDSKATNVAAARRGVAAYADRPLRLIVGGSRKGEDFAPLAAALGPNVRAVYAIGETAGELLALDAPAALGARDLATAVAAPPATPSRATSSCSRPRARASTSSATTRTAATAFRRLVGAVLAA